MSVQGFDARTDAASALAHGWLQQGEQPDWTRPRRRVGYEVKGRKRNGKRRAHLALRVLGWIVLSPLMLILLIGEMFNEAGDISDWDEQPDRAVIAKGSHADCTAARLADFPGTFWVLTDRRFALVAVEAVPGQPYVRLDTVWQLTADHYVYHLPVAGNWRRHHEPARVVLRDGSSLTFLEAPGR